MLSNYMSQFQLRVTLDVAWERLVEKKQTLFPVEQNGEDKRALKGAPPSSAASPTLRATKGVNMHPFPLLQVQYEDGSPYVDEEEFSLELVSALDKKLPLPGSCSCGGHPILTESKSFQLVKAGGKLYGKISEGRMEFTKLQIGCCTGARGHGAPFSLKAEFTKEGSPLQGVVAYSRPLEVGAKGPFAKIFALNQLAQQHQQQQQEQQSSSVFAKPAPVLFMEQQLVQSTETYCGASEMVDLLKALNLYKYIPLFLKHEIDLPAFIKLTETDLCSMGITLVGPKVKILKAIKDFEQQNQAPLTPQLSTPKEMLDDSSMWTFSAALESFGDFDQGPPTKKARFAPQGAPIPLDFDKEKMLSIYVYLAFITDAKHGLKKKILFMVKSRKEFKETNSTVQLITEEVAANFKAKNKRIGYEGIEDCATAPQLMLYISPDKNGDWAAKSQITNHTWDFKKGDFIKIDNHHQMDIGINIHHFLILDNVVPTWVEDFASPKKYPILFPGGSLEIGIDENRDGRLALATEPTSTNPAEIFAITHHGNVVGDLRRFTEACVFSFKRKKVDMKKVDSLDDLQKELFLSTCLDPTCLA